MKFICYGDMYFKATGEIIQKAGAKSFYKRTLNKVLKDILWYAEHVDDWTIVYTIYTTKGCVEDEFDLMEIIQLQIKREERV